MLFVFVVLSIELSIAEFRDNELKEAKEIKSDIYQSLTFQKLYEQNIANLERNFEHDDAAIDMRDIDKMIKQLTMFYLQIDGLKNTLFGKQMAIKNCISILKSKQVFIKPIKGLTVDNINFKPSLSFYF